MPRYLPVQMDAANEPVKRVYAELQSKLGHVPNFLKTLAHQDRLLKVIADALLSFVEESSLSEKTRRLVMLRVCQLDKCKQMIDVHTNLAKKAGWTDDHVKAMEDYSQSELFSFYEKEVLKLVELVRSTPDEIPNDYWAQLDNHYTSDQVVEMITLTGFVGMINHLVLALQVEPDPQPVGP